MTTKKEALNALKSKIEDVRIQADMLRRACYGFWQKYRKPLSVDFGEQGDELADAVYDAGHAIKTHVLLDSVQGLNDWVRQYANMDENSTSTIPSIEDFETKAGLLTGQVTALRAVFYGLLFDGEGWLVSMHKPPYTSFALSELQALDKVTRQFAYDLETQIAPYMVSKAKEALGVEEAPEAEAEEK